MLPAPAIVPPMVLLLLPAASMIPSPPWPRMVDPLGARPMMFPSITTLEAPRNDTPALKFPEITLPSPAAVPPIVLLVAVDVLIETPTSLPRSFPLVLVPIRFPKTTFPVAPDPVITIPEPVPPMTFLCRRPHPRSRCSCCRRPDQSRQC